jgi:hypothetical protein
MLTVKTNVVAGKVCKSGRVYSRQAIEGALKGLREQISHGMVGSILNRDGDRIAEVNDPTHRVVDARLEDDNLVVDLEILDTPAGKKLLEQINGGAVAVAKPVISVPLMFGNQDGAEGKQVDDLQIVRVQIEVEKKA